MEEVLVVGGGLAGCEAAWQLAERGHGVTLLEMRPVRSTPAHQTSHLAELVCTNSFKSEGLANAHGLLKAEMRDMGSILLAAADATRVPAGQALAVDRDLFARAMTDRMESHARIDVVRGEVTSLPEGPAVIATGPLTSGPLASAIGAALGDEGLAFYDSIAPIVGHESVDLDVAFYASRWDKGGEDDYLNCPMSREEYEAFLAALRAADVYPGHDWEDIPYFEGCLPIEVMASAATTRSASGP
jgi:methylenetetrahydrofolate--tRNA-(uracil-5-)-methyltransferase